jgi:hypothetical protein
MNTPELLGIDEMMTPYRIFVGGTIIKQADAIVREPRIILSRAYRVVVHYPKALHAAIGHIISSIIDSLDARGVMHANQELRELDPRPCDGDIMRITIKPIKWEGCL